MKKKKKALFLDRDGIINEDTYYPHRIEDIQFKDDIFPVCKAAQEKGYMLIVITNQAGIARGMFGEEEVITLHQWMMQEFLSRGIEIKKFYFCPYHTKGIVEKYRKDSFYRKPNPGMLMEAIEEFSISIRDSIMLGDKPSDRIKLDGLKSVILKSEYSSDDFDIEHLTEVIAYFT